MVHILSLKQQGNLNGEDLYFLKGNGWLTLEF